MQFYGIRQGLEEKFSLQPGVRIPNAIAHSYNFALHGYLKNKWVDYMVCVIYMLTIIIIIIIINEVLTKVKLSLKAPPEKLKTIRVDYLN